MTDDLANRDAGPTRSEGLDAWGMDPRRGGHGEDREICARIFVSFEGRLEKLGKA